MSHAWQLGTETVLGLPPRAGRRRQRGDKAAELFWSN